MFQILSSLESISDTAAMDEFLKERKRECVKVFEQYDGIAELCEEYFNLEYEDCKKRVEEQLAMQKPMLNEVERYLTEVQEAGDKEIRTLKDNIANYIREVALTRSNRIEEVYADMSTQPLIMEVWSLCAEDITSKDVWYSFLKTQQETALLWKKAVDDLLMLSAELERYRYKYNKTKSHLERAIYWMNRNYRENMPGLTKIQRQIASFMDRKHQLFKALFNLEQEMKNEKAEQHRLKLRYYSKIANLQLSIKLADARMLSTHNKVLKSKKMEVLDLLQEILEGDQYIHENLLKRSWNAIDLHSLEMEENETTAKRVDSTPVAANAEAKRLLKTLHEDTFADAYREFISNGDFVNVLNHIAEELGYMLDFQWVDYVKKTLEIEQEVRWLELFKVFKINFTDDIKNLKEHMKPFSKKSNGELVFDLNGALDGFLHFVWLNRQTLDTDDSFAQKRILKIHEEFWSRVDETVPKTLLWDSVLELLEKYKVSLQSRRRLIEARSDIVIENEELDKYLENYYNFEVPSDTNLNN
ncbi:uncharacterized protein NPIL_137661 [Nephila pilipes]|uniref:Dynein regulatory complex protein 1 C-terminal domain-containing protein n=1 Tax=Nephila pilipes TaxID=299642 RepID=A0A8X6N2U3_NEPPI|nr:uncharacterized protein NPIL_137661 [Nephila pilipes]